LAKTPTTLEVDVAKMNGCNAFHEAMLKAQGKERMVPKTFARNNLAKGGVNKDLSGGATSGVKQQLRKGKASSSPKNYTKV
jgi:hypothetical protein